MKIDREKLIGKLQAVQPGLSDQKKEENTQSSCFVFKDGKIYTFNNEVCCHVDSGLDASFQVAVPAKQFVNNLEQFPNKLIEIELAKAANGRPAEICLLGKKKRRKGWVSLEAEILLETHIVDTPDKWHSLPTEQFADACQMVVACTSGNDANFQLTCVHFHPGHIEACDNFQLIRHQLEMNVQEPFLIRRAPLKHVATLGMTEWGETTAWVHFRNPTGLVLSCRRYLLKFPDLNPLLAATGESLVWPDNMDKIVRRAASCSKESVVDTKVLVELEPLKVTITGRGALSGFREEEEMNYRGQAVAFLIAPDIFVGLLKHSTSCQLAPGRLVAESEKYKYVACSTPVKDATSKENKPEVAKG